jgi:hypothetical protein
VNRCGPEGRIAFLSRLTSRRRPGTEARRAAPAAVSTGSQATRYPYGAHRNEPWYGKRSLSDAEAHPPALQAYRSTPVVDSDSETAAGLVADEPEDTDVLGDSAYPSELRDHLQRANHGYFGCGTLGIDV